MAIINFLALGDWTNPLVVWRNKYSSDLCLIKYSLNIHKIEIFAIQIYYLYFFFTVKNDHGAFSKVEQGSFLDWIELFIYTSTGRYIKQTN